MYYKYCLSFELFSVIVCDQPPYVAHSRCIIGGNSSGSMAMCACNDGYYLDGIPAVFCQSDGDWSPVKFSCKRGLLLLSLLFTYVKSFLLKKLKYQSIMSLPHLKVNIFFGPFGFLLCLTLLFS